MQIEQIKDILDWTVSYHQQMGQCYEQCVNQSESTRIKMLLDYLASHEQQLANAISKYEAIADPRDLGTWCVEYVNKNPMLAHTLCEANLNELDIHQIVAKTIDMHDQLIDLYVHLAARAPTERTKELFDNLVLLEQKETMRMVRDSESLEDL